MEKRSEGRFPLTDDRTLLYIAGGVAGESDKPHVSLQFETTATATNKSGGSSSVTLDGEILLL